MKIVGPALIVFGFLEVGQNLVPGPAVTAKFGPVIIIRAVPASVQHGIDRAGATQHPATRLITASIVEAGLRRCLEAPVVQLGRQHRGNTSRSMNKHARIRPARFEQTDFDIRILRQPAGDNRTARATPDDNVIVHTPSPHPFETGQCDSILAAGLSELHSQRASAPFRCRSCRRARCRLRQGSSGFQQKQRARP